MWTWAWKSEVNVKCFPLSPHPCQGLLLKLKHWFWRPKDSCFFFPSTGFTSECQHTPSFKCSLWGSKFRPSGLLSRHITNQAVTPPFEDFSLLKQSRWESLKTNSSGMSSYHWWRLGISTNFSHSWLGHFWGIFTKIINNIQQDWVPGAHRDHRLRTEPRVWFLHFHD